MYNWIETTLNVSGGVTQAIAVILALAVVLLLFALFIFILKRLTGNQSTQNRNRQPRIAVMDSATIDTRRRLVLIRRDNIEHLILVGGPSDVVVEQNIVRNTPLTQAMPQARTGQHSPTGIGGHSSIRSPMAPGPDIPVRPDDVAANGEAVPPPPAVQARAPASTPAPAPAPTPVAAPSRAAEDKPKTAPAMGARPGPVPEVQGRPQAARAPLPPQKKPEAGREPDQATDLLWAATRNGFNKSVTKVQAPDKGADIPPAALPASSATTAPAVQPASQPPASQSPVSNSPPSKSPAVTATKPETRAGTALKSLARPFSPRDRPSYGNHSITPPASGPAARAKTALLKPSEPEQPVDAVGPSSTGSPSPDKGQGQAEPAQAKDGVRLAGAATGETSPEQDRPAAADTAPDAPQPDSSPAAPSVSATPEDTHEKKPSPAPVVTAGPTPEPDPVGPTPQDITLNLEDLLEDPLPANTTAGTEVDASVPEQKQEQSSGAKTPDGSAGNESPSNGGTEQKGNAEPVKAAPQPTAGQTAGPVAAPKPGLGDKNPIEEEMAKILDELGGHPN